MFPRTLNPTPGISPEASERERFDAFEDMQKLLPSDRDVVYALLKQAQTGDMSGLEAVYDLVYDEVPVPCDEFVLSSRYLGLQGLVNTEKVEILQYFDMPTTREMDILAGSGSGKGFIAGCAMARMVYRLCCLRRPDLFYLLGPLSRISVLNASVSKDQASDVVFTEFKARVEASNWFRGKYKAGARKARFPKRVYALSMGSTAPAVFGYHTIMGIMDEASFMLDGATDLAPDILTGLLKSLNTRFPGAFKLLVTSTIRDAVDFTYLRVADVKADAIRIRYTALTPAPPIDTHAPTA